MVKVEVAGNVLSDPVRIVKAPDDVVSVEVGQFAPVRGRSVVIGIALEHCFNIGLARVQHHRPCAHNKIGVAGDFCVSVLVDDVAGDHQRPGFSHRDQQGGERLRGLDRHRQVVDRFELFDQHIAVLVDELGVVLTESLVAKDRILSRELSAVQGRQILPMNIGLDLVDEVEFVDDFRQLGHRVGDLVARVHVVDEVEALEDRGVGAAVDGHSGVKQATVFSPDLDHAAILWSAGLLLLGLRNRFLLFLLLFGCGVLLLLLHRLLFGLLLNLVLLLLDLSGRRLTIVVIVATADQREPGRANARTRARPQ